MNRPISATAQDVLPLIADRTLKGAQQIFVLRPAEDHARQQGLHLAAKQREENQQHAGASQQQRQVERRIRGGQKSKPPRAGHARYQQRGQEDVRQKAQERVQQHEAVVLQQNQQGQGNRRVM